MRGYVVLLLLLLQAHSDSHPVSASIANDDALISRHDVVLLAVRYREEIQISLAAISICEAFAAVYTPIHSALWYPLTADTLLPIRTGAQLCCLFMSFQT